MASLIKNVDMVKTNSPKKSPDLTIDRKPDCGWYSPAVWCRTLGVSKSTISRWIRLGLLKHTRIRKRILIHESAIEVMFRRHEIPAWRSEIEKNFENKDD